MARTGLQNGAMPEARETREFVLRLRKGRRGTPRAEGETADIMPGERS
jgi:hypothetical protein